jgi:hypothetical protein
MALCFYYFCHPGIINGVIGLERMVFIQLLQCSGRLMQASASILHKVQGFQDASSHILAKKKVEMKQD